MRRVILAIAFLLGLLVSPAFGQSPVSQKFHVAVDTAGVSEYPPGSGIYITWVYALATPTSWPSSGILVAFDCRGKRVKRLAHVVYQMNADSTGVEGPVVEDYGEWQSISIPKLFDLVCSVGPSHAPSVVEPTVPREKFMDPRVRVT